MADTLTVGQRVALTTDLTRYHPQLVTGAKGVLLDTRAKKAPWTGDTRFGHVVFDQAGPWDILWDGLLPVPGSLDDIEDGQLMAEARRRRLLGKPAPVGTEAERCLQFVAEYLGPDVWEDLMALYRKTTKTAPRK